MNCNNLCNPCMEAKCLAFPGCENETNTLVIGTVEPDTECIIFIKNADNGVTKQFEATSDNNGLLSIDLNDVVPFINDVAPFKLWVGDYVDILVGETTVNCIELKFNKVFDADGVYVSSDEQTITI